MIKKSIRTETKQVEVYEYTCDLCGKEAKQQNYSAALQECEVCGKQICRPCRIGTDSLSSRYVSGDYPYYRVCIKCWKIGEPYRERMNEVCDNAKIERDNILGGWRTEAKK
jgi:hypothetical protein